MKLTTSMARTAKLKALTGLIKATCAARLWPVLLALALPAVVQGQYTYTTSDGKATITGYTGPGGDITIPGTIDGLPVVSIAAHAFQNNNSLTSVTISNGVTTIGNGAFNYCLGLSSVVLGGSVASISNSVFFSCTSLANVTLGKNVTSIGDNVFFDCTGLVAITVDPLNPFFSSASGVLFNKSQTTLIQYPCGRVRGYTIPGSVTNIENGAFQYCALTSLTIPASVVGIGSSAFAFCFQLNSVELANSVTSIGDSAFYFCSSLTSITIPSSVTSIGAEAFSYCTSLTGVYFQGNAPSLGSSAFDHADNATVYYLPGTTVWGPTYGGRPTVLWNPQVPTSNSSFGVRSNAFGFTITGSSNLVIVVEAGTNLVNPAWSPVGTNILTNGSSYFSDPQWMNYPSRFYRLRSP